MSLVSESLPFCQPSQRCSSNATSFSVSKSLASAATFFSFGDLQEELPRVLDLLAQRDSFGDPNPTGTRRCAAYHPILSATGIYPAQTVSGLCSLEHNHHRESRVHHPAPDFPCSPTPCGYDREPYPCQSAEPTINCGCVSIWRRSGARSRGSNAFQWRNGRFTANWLHQGDKDLKAGQRSEPEEQAVQKFLWSLQQHQLVHWQLSRQTSLRVLGLGYEYQATGGNEWYHKENTLCMPTMFEDTVDMSLDSGLGQLKALVKLEALGFESWNG